MIDVVIAEDELIARENIKLFVSRYPSFRIVAEAENGDEACEKVRLHQPDLLLTDIKMAGKNGIDLLKTVKSECPYVESVVISAYSNFDYAKDAMKYGASDYLIKPINPSLLQDVMERMELHIHEKQISERTEIFRNMLINKPIDDNRLIKYFPFKSYHLALIRELGIPYSYMSMNSGKNSIEITSEIGEISCVYGRDSQETLYLWPAEVLDVEFFEKGQIKKQNDKDGYYTIISYKKGMSVSEIPDKVYRLYQVLHDRLIIGKSQIIHINDLEYNEPKKNKDFDVELLQYLIKKNEWAKAENDVIETMKNFEVNQIPLYSVKLSLDYMLMNLAKKFGLDISFVNDMGDIYCYDKNMDELIVSVIDIMHSKFKLNVNFYEKIDTEEFYSKVIQYVEENSRKPLTLNTLSTEFHVSKSYMSRLFKKYANKSFNDYLTGCRLNKARKLFEDNPELLIKDVAALVGIPDQFYFSRLFRSVVGKTPTQYCEILTNKK